jgi:hypothetical protein
MRAFPLTIAAFGVLALAAAIVPAPAKRRMTTGRSTRASWARSWRASASSATSRRSTITSGRRW